MLVNHSTIMLDLGTKRWEAHEERHLNCRKSSFLLDSNLGTVELASRQLSLTPLDHLTTRTHGHQEPPVRSMM